MRLKSLVSMLSCFAAVLALSGCGLSGGNPTQGIGLASNECLQDMTVTTPQCLPGSDLYFTPNVPVWGSEFSDYYVNGVDQTQGTVAYFGHNGDPPATTGGNGKLVVNNALVLQLQIEDRRS